MKIKLILALALLAASLPINAFRYAGGDISLLPEYEKAKAQYRDNNGKVITDFLPWCKEQGMNAMRVRLFLNPKDYKGTDADPNACQDLEYILPLCRRIKDAGFKLLLDFHYSDFWADPGKQWTPEVWRDLDDEALGNALYEYTRNTLLRLKEEGAAPDLIQPGNEISYGMMWGPQGTSQSQLKKTTTEAGWQRFGALLKQAIKGCREVCPDAPIIMHTERIENQKVLIDFYTHMKDMEIDYDVIGLSFYPYFHGKIVNLESGIALLEKRFTDKEIMIVETGYPYKWEVGGTKYDHTATYPYSDAGQAAYTQDLVNMLLKHPKITGLFWWWMEYNAYRTNLSGWYNAPLWDSLTGKAGKAVQALASFADSNDSAVDNVDVDIWEGKDAWFDLMGRPLSSAPSSPGLYIHNGRKVMIGR